ncbi:MAG: cell division protein FtsB [Proteobacteria bacterium]|nr:MAG: cell division protein FtsB [Pseudomonadota bacterium]
MGILSTLFYFGANVQVMRIHFTQVLLIGLSLLALVLFVRLWVGTGSYPDVWSLEQQIASQQQTNVEQQARNDRLREDVNNIGRDDDAIEAHARSELGMVKKGEIFYQVILRDNVEPTAILKVDPSPYVE